MAGSESMSERVARGDPTETNRIKVVVRTVQATGFYFKGRGCCSFCIKLHKKADQRGRRGWRGIMFSTHGVGDHGRTVQHREGT